MNARNLADCNTLLWNYQPVFADAESADTESKNPAIKAGGITTRILYGLLNSAYPLHPTIGETFSKVAGISVGAEHSPRTKLTPARSVFYNQRARSTHHCRNF
jgi:hypothetical protein